FQLEKIFPLFSLLVEYNDFLSLKLVTYLLIG
ncbi:unnamed protein product, partial [marine sediment metagenome]